MKPSTSYLIDMANDISAFFETEPDRAAGVQGMVLHLQKFWEPRMRRQIVRIAGEDGSALSALAKDAIAELGRRIDPATGDMRAA